jgi:hypothetical protein
MFLDSCQSEIHPSFTEIETKTELSYLAVVQELPENDCSQIWYAHMESVSLHQSDAPGHHAPVVHNCKDCLSFLVFVTVE